jgi:hypothetical protein
MRTTDNPVEKLVTTRRRELTAKLEPFDSFWEAPDDIESGYRSFHLFYKDNYLRFLPQDRNAKILCVSCGPGYGVALLHELGYRDVLGIDSFLAKIAHARKRNLNCRLAFDWRKRSMARTTCCSSSRSSTISPKTRSWSFSHSAGRSCAPADACYASS